MSTFLQSAAYMLPTFSALKFRGSVEHEDVQTAIDHLKRPTIPSHRPFSSESFSPLAELVSFL